MNGQNGNRYDVRDLIPQRYPFLLVDCILELSDDRILTKKQIADGDYLAISGSFLIEHMAQSASALFGYRFREKSCEHLYLAGIEDANIVHRSRAGETLFTEVVVVIAVANLAKVQCRSYVHPSMAEQDMAGFATLVLYVD